MAFLDAAISYYNTHYHLDMNYLEQQVIYKQIHVSRSAQCSIKIGESSSSEKRPYHEIIKPDVFQLFKRKVYISSIAFNLTVFTVIVLFACHSFLCNDSSAPLINTVSP
ncbi:hypothetical protein Patl1_20265 [Pistacia atlantica]|uniref:Uncharacterized protein n=1 Tax=Pistacia atlantica TaxID=434234 RepID=A0ACC1BN20_9ROSI|nr:hypothetical protein Patl1_20265 [Pistacia atlantica]